MLGKLYSYSFFVCLIWRTIEHFPLIFSGVLLKYCDMHTIYQVFRVVRGELTRRASAGLPKAPPY